MAAGGWQDGLHDPPLAPETAGPSAGVAPERWQSAQQRLKTGFSLTNTHGAVVQRAVAGSAVRKPLDDAGRLCLGEKLTALLGLSGKAGLVGCLDRFEIWEPGKLEATMGAIEQVADETLEQLMI
ncbi:MAG: division/cell wall cluster transcriptional repressor MraZ [Verrucomicrobia bacterium]|nr:division/cell wall cluster transcriptional repressor MraZ [Verrucomicrobiota bacterium]